MVLFSYHLALIYTHIYRHKPVEVHLVNLWVKRLNVFLPLAEENGEIDQRSFHWEHLGEAADLCANLIQHAFYAYKQKDKKKIRKQHKLVQFFYIN